MKSETPTLEELEIHQKVNAYLQKKAEQKPYVFQPKMFWSILAVIVAFLSWYGLTIILFGQDFWVMSVSGQIPK